MPGEFVHATEKVENIKLVLEYDGAGFSGWQKLTSGGKTYKRTVQEVVENALTQILDTEIILTGASRTDSGVHARGQAANFRVDSPKLSVVTILKALNNILPRDISIRSVTKVPYEFNARRDAKCKTYKYFWHNNGIRPALGRQYCWHYVSEINLGVIQSECRKFIGKKDFRQYAYRISDKKNTVCALTEVSARKIKGGFIVFTITGDRFLHKMVRWIVGYLIQRGQGKINPVPWVVPPQGLCLEKIFY
ncbi:MAG: tRNA pseudouridine(38-40) synthase TruA [Elusimicrobiota bacterium]